MEILEKNTTGKVVISIISFLFRMKKCSKCNEFKDLNNFSKRKSSKDGLSFWCNNCNKIYKSSRKEYIKEYDKKYKELNKEKNKEYYLKYYEIKSEECKKRSKDWSQNNPKKDKINKLRFWENNPNYSKEYYLKNKNEHYNRNKQWIINERETNPLFRISDSIRSLIHSSFKNILKENGKKSKKSINILGCNLDEFYKHIESKFESWMNINNYGNPKDGIFEPNKTWDLDHIIPISSAKTEEDIIRLNHYTNLQPLCSYYNRFVKRNKINEKN